MSADEREVKLLLENLTMEKTETWHRKSFYRGTLAGQEVILTTTGIGKTRAAARTQFLIDHFDMQSLIFLGVAGALDPKLRHGDVVVSSRTTEHDFDLPTPPTGERERHWYEADPRLVALALEAGQRLGIAHQLHLGQIASGDQAIVDSERKQWLWQNFGAACVEMEGAAVATVCWLNQMPFVIIRGISDLADQNALQDVQQWYGEAAERSAKIVLEMLRSWSTVSDNSCPTGLSR